MPAKATIQHRRDTAAQWTSINPTLAVGELGYETDTGKFKIGRAVDDTLQTWSQLSYQGALSSVSAPLSLVDGALALGVGSGLATTGGNIVADFANTGSGKVLAATHNVAESTTALPVHGLQNGSKVVGTTDTQELSNKSFVNFIEKVNVVAAAPASTQNIDTNTAAAWYFTSNATANFILNFRASSSASLSSVLAIGQSLTITVMHTNGSTAYFPNVFRVDGTTVTPKWQVSARPEAGDINSINSYTFTILKTGSSSYTVFASQSRFD